MAKGRKSTPRSIAALRGNPRKRTLHTSSDPVFETAIPPAPEYLTGQALIEWDRITQELAAKQIITNVDMSILAVYCQAVGQLHEYSEAMKTEERTIVSTRGIPQINPIVKEIRNLRQEIAKYSSELGITPVSRNKVKVVGSAKKNPTKQEALAEKLFMAKVKA